jgi:large subunit ribosomal protein L6
MSRVGKRPVAIPSGVNVRVADGRVHVKGPKGELSMHVLAGTSVAIAENEARVSAERITRNPAFGTMRAQIQNMVLGVTSGFSKTLEIVGTGYRAAMEGKTLVLQVGYSHPIKFQPPEGITIKVENPTRLVVSGADKAMVGQAAADIRGFRPPEPYKGKGIKYEGEYIRRKAGKTAAGTTA